MNLNYQFILDALPSVLKGIPATVGITLVSLVLATPLAYLIAIVKTKQIKILSRIAETYTSLVRGTPIVLQILLVYSLFPSMLNALSQKAGLSFNVFDINPIYYAFIVFAINSSAGLSEIFRSSLTTVNKGQLESALSIGFSTFQAYKQIIIPQALVSALPNLCNLTVNLIKTTSLAFLMTVKDVTAIARIEASFGYHYIEAYILIFLIYILLCSLTQLLFNLAEKRFGRFRQLGII